LQFFTLYAQFSSFLTIFTWWHHQLGKCLSVFLSLVTNFQFIFNYQAEKHVRCSEPLS